MQQPISNIDHLEAKESEINISNLKAQIEILNQVIQTLEQKKSILENELENLQKKPKMQIRKSEDYSIFGKKLKQPLYECTKTLNGHTGAVISASLLANNWIATGSEDNTLKVWDITTGKCLKTLRDNNGIVGFINQLPNGNIIALSGLQTKVWDINTEKCLKTYDTPNYNCITILPNGNAVSGLNDGTIKVWDIDTGKCLSTMKEDTSSITSIVSFPNGNIITGSMDSTIKMWDISTGECLKRLKGHGDNAVASILPNGDIISGSDDSLVKVWNIATGECLRTLKEHTGIVFFAEPLQNGKAVSGSSDGVRVWDIKRGECLSTLVEDNPNNTPMCIAVLPNGNFICGYDDGTLKFWIDNELQNKYQIRKTSRILAQGLRDQNCFFNQVSRRHNLSPGDVLIKIASFTGNPQCFTENESIAIAKKYFKKP